MRLKLGRLCTYFCLSRTLLMRRYELVLEHSMMLGSELPRFGFSTATSNRLWCYTLNVFLKQFSALLDASLWLPTRSWCHTFNSNILYALTYSNGCYRRLPHCSWHFGKWLGWRVIGFSWNFQRALDATLLNFLWTSNTLLMLRAQLTLRTSNALLTLPSLLI